MKKNIILLVITLSVFLVACGSGSLEKTMLSGHKWGETENQGQSKGKELETLLGKELYVGDGTHYNDDNELNAMAYTTDNIYSADEYYAYVDKFAAELKTEPTEQEDKSRIKNKFYKGSIRFEIHYWKSDGYISIYMINDKYGNVEY